MSSSTFCWLTRCLPALSICCVSAVLAFSFVVDPYGKGEPGKHLGNATVWQLLLSVYTCFLHFLSVAFPMRVIYAIGELTRKVKEAAADKDVLQWQQSTAIDEDGKEEAQFPAPLFVIVIPAYKESMQTLQETLRVLASHPRARHAYHIYLAMEEKEERAVFKAAELIAMFDSLFFRISYTLHPSDIPGEAQGKSSNEAWAAKQIFRDYPDEAKPNILITVMDADTHLSLRYFAQVARAHNEKPETNQTTIYVPPLVFDRNLTQVPLVVRTADLLWAAAGISSLYAGSRICIPTSVYTLPLTLVEHVGGWDTDSGAIGEDMHMYIKLFFALSGNLNVHVVHAAASQCNVSSDLQGYHGYYDGIHSRYKQALRHMWGALDTGFAFRQMLQMISRHRNANQRRRGDVSPEIHNANWTALQTGVGHPRSLSPGLIEAQAFPSKTINLKNCLTLMHRLFEAHFLPIHLAAILATSGIHDAFCPSFLTPDILRNALALSGYCRFTGWLLMVFYFYRYERYHKICVKLRQEEMRGAGLLEAMVENNAFSEEVSPLLKYGFLEGITFPISGILFGSVPALQATLSHIFTERLTYVVSLKPQMAMKKLRGTATP